MQQRVGKQIFSISVMCSNNIGAESLESCHRGPGLPIPSLRILNLFNRLSITCWNIASHLIRNPQR